MKQGTLCMVIKKNSHHPSQFGDLVVVKNDTYSPFNTSSSNLIVAVNLKTGKTHHYWPEQLCEMHPEEKIKKLLDKLFKHIILTENPNGEHHANT